MIFKPGDVGFVMNDALISKIIGKAMGSLWSHSFLVIGEVHGVMMVLETSDFEVTINTLERYMDGRHISIFRDETLNDAEAKEVCLKGFKLLGEIYGYFQLLSFGLREVFKKFGIKIPNFIRWGLVCCAVPMYSFEERLKIDPESINTEEFYQVLKMQFSLIHSTIKKQIQ